MVSTIASLIRDNGNAIRALAMSQSQDGKKYLYKDILLTLGPPTSPSHIQALSKFLNKDGIRRRPEFTRKRGDHPEIPELIQESTFLEQDVHDLICGMNETMWRMKAAVDELSAAFDALCDAYNALTPKVEDKNEPFD